MRSARMRSSAGERERGRRYAASARAIRAYIVDVRLILPGRPGAAAADHRLRRCNIGSGSERTERETGTGAMRTAHETLWTRAFLVHLSPTARLPGRPGAGQ